MTDSTSIFDRIVEPGKGDLSPQLARYVLSLTFPKRIQNRYVKLSEKAQLGALSKREEAELDEYLSANAFLTVLQSKARVSLVGRSSMSVSFRHAYDVAQFWLAP